MIDTTAIIHDNTVFLVELTERTIDPATLPDNIGNRDIAAWRAGEWHHVTVTVTPVLDGDRQDHHAIDITGAIHGTGDGWTVTTGDIARDPNTQLACKQALNRLRTLRIIAA